MEGLTPTTPASLPPLGELIADEPGQFYLRELPPLHAVLNDMSGMGLLVVDGCADLDPACPLGHMRAEFAIPVMGQGRTVDLPLFRRSVVSDATG